MKHADIIRLPLLVKNILMRYSDADNLVSMGMIRQYLEDEGISCDRRSVYRAIDVLNECGDEILYERNHGVRGYRIRHPFTQGEALFLCDAVQSSSSLSAKASDEFCDRILSGLSLHEQEEMPPLVSAVSKTDSGYVLQLIELLLKAAANRNPVEFRYYDLSVTKKKQYRKQNKIYHLVPYAVVSNDSRFYAVLYSEVHHSFANYRIDKMDMVTVLKEQADPVYFSLEDHMRSSFNMYHGDPETVTVDFDLNLANVVFDEFGKDIIISKVSADRFTASIRTAITPTLISWLLQFYDRMEVKKPEHLRDRLSEIGKRLAVTYEKGD